MVAVSVAGFIKVAKGARSRVHRGSRNSLSSRDRTLLMELEGPNIEAPGAKPRRSRSMSIIKAQVDTSVRLDASAGAQHLPPERVIPSQQPSNLPDEEISGWNMEEEDIEEILRLSGDITRKRNSVRSKGGLSISSLSGTYKVDEILFDDESMSEESPYLGTEDEGQTEQTPYEPLQPVGPNRPSMEEIEKAPTEVLDFLLGEVSRQEEARVQDMDHQELDSHEEALDQLLEKVNLQAEEESADHSVLVAPFPPIQAPAFVDLLVKPKIDEPQDAPSAPTFTRAPVSQPSVHLRNLYPIIITAALMSLGVAIFASYGGFQTMTRSWLIFTSAGSPAMMFRKFLSTAPIACSVALQLSGLATAKKIRREMTTGLLDPLPFVTMVSNCLVWASYALLNSNVTCFVPNFTGYLFGTYYLTNFAKYTRRSMKGYYIGLSIVLCGLVAGVLFLGGQAAYPIGLFGACSCVSMYASPLATIRSVIRTKSTASLCFARSLCSSVLALSWFSYGLVIANDPFIYGPNGVGLMATLAQLGCFAAYGFGDRAGGDPAAPPALPVMGHPQIKLA